MKKLMMAMALAAMTVAANPVTADSPSTTIACGARAVTTAATAVECSSFCWMYWESAQLIINTKQALGTIMMLY